MHWEISHTTFHCCCSGPKSSFGVKIAVGSIAMMNNTVRDKDKYSAIILHEDVLEDAKKVFKRVFEALGMDLKYLDAAVATALRTTAQGSVTGGRGSHYINLSPDDIKLIDDIFARVGLPQLSCETTAETMRKIYNL